MLDASEQERQRIAGELHDSIGQQLSAIKFHIECFASDFKDDLKDTQYERLGVINDRVREAIGELRRIAMDLRPAMLDDLGLVPTLSWFCRDYAETYAHVEVLADISIEETDVPEALKVQIFRIIQEAFTNAARHAGASTVRLALWQTGKQVNLQISDDGEGFAQEARSSTAYGLRSMRQRVETHGGSFELTTAPQQGVEISIGWPL